MGRKPNYVKREEVFMWSLKWWIIAEIALGISYYVITSINGV